MSPAALEHPLLADCAIRHGFGCRGAAPPEPLLRPQQVHGARVTRALPGSTLAAADAVVSDLPGQPIGVVTADCVPVLAASRSGRQVGAIHAGWRGLALGVVSAGIAALRRLAGPEGLLVAVIGPHIGPCCYEIDAPVIEALAPRFDAALEGALEPSRPGHARLDLAALVRAELLRSGVGAAWIGDFPETCTRCDAARFHSFRRDGPRAGRLVHFAAARAGVQRAPEGVGRGRA